MENYRRNVAQSLVFLPLVNGIGHLPPAIGGAWAAVGERRVDYPVLLLLFSVHMLVDSGDKFKDMPRDTRPSAKFWVPWFGSFLSLAVWTTYLCGMGTAVQLLRFLALELLWSTPSIPFYTSKKGLHFLKLKNVFGVLKSVFCGFCTGLMDTNTIALHACALHPSMCSSPNVLVQSLAYSMLYNFIRETICDARDVAEDKREGMRTLPIALGSTGTMVFLFLTATLGDVIITGGFGMEPLLRSVITMVMCAVVVRQPRENGKYWGFLTLFGLLPAWWAQYRLL